MDLCQFQVIFPFFCFSLSEGFLQVFVCLCSIVSVTLGISSLSEGLPLALGEAGLVSACPCNVGAIARAVPLGELKPTRQQREAGCGSCRGTILIPVVFRVCMVD